MREGQEKLPSKERVGTLCSESSLANACTVCTWKTRLIRPGVNFPHLFRVLGPLFGVLGLVVDECVCVELAVECGRSTVHARRALV